MKGVILGITPGATIVDLTHEIPPQEVHAGALVLAGAIAYFPPGTIHVAVVDPGVGSKRRALLVETGHGFLIGPDNGLLSLAAPTETVRRILDVGRSPYRLQPVSATFHGRDVFAPIAAHLAAGVAPSELGTAAGRRLKRLRIPQPKRRRGALVGEVLWIDRFGNATTNVAATDLLDAGFRLSGASVTIAGNVLRLRPSYTSVPVGSALAILNSSGLLEIAVNRGSAAATLGIEPHTTVAVTGR